MLRCIQRPVSPLSNLARMIAIRWTDHTICSSCRGRGLTRAPAIYPYGPVPVDAGGSMSVRSLRAPFQDDNIYGTSKSGGCFYQTGRYLRQLSPASRLVTAVVIVAFVIIGIAGGERSEATATPGGTSVAAATQTKLLGLLRGASPSVSGTTTGAPTAIPPAPPTAVVVTTVPATPRPTSVRTPTSTAAAACAPTDQDQYVYSPDRLVVEAGCIHVTGVVEAVRTEADGDFHILLALDPAYAHLLTPANQGEELGDLVVEPICVGAVSQTSAMAACASDPDPLRPPYPGVGDKIWMEGRFVFDLDHGGWAELHPLYRWGFE